MMDFKKMIFFPVLAPREREMVLKMKMARVAASKITLMRLKLLLLSWKGNWAYSKEMQPAIVPLVRDVEGWRRQVGLPICNIGTSHSDTVSSSWDLKNSRADFIWRSHQLHLEAVITSNFRGLQNVDGRSAILISCSVWLCRHELVRMEEWRCNNLFW